MKKLFFLTIILCLFSIPGCKREGINSQKELFTLLDSRHTAINFRNDIQNTEQFNIFNYRNFYNGGGVGIGDINNDGLQDIYFTSNMGENKLYLNKGDLRFEDITDKAGVALIDKWSTGVVMVDINHDGFLDIYVCNAGYAKGKDQKNALFINNGDLTFTERAAGFGLDDNGYSSHAAFFDYDGDGDLDVYILNNSFIPINTLNYSNKRELKAEDWPVADFVKGGGDKLLRNDNGVFNDVSEEAGIYQSLIGFGLGVTVGDVNNDGWDDLYISNDFYEKDYLYLNNGDGTFTESLEEYFGHISHSSMGADMRDINNDGRQDIFVTDMMPRSDYRIKTTASFDDINLRKLKEQQGFYKQYMHNTLQLNSVCGFRDISFHSGTAATDWSWGALMFDMNNDGWCDLYVCNGVFNDVIDLDFMDFFANEIYQKMALSGDKKNIFQIIEKMPSVPLENAAFINKGDLNFEYASHQIGLRHKSFSNGAAYADLDNDGDLDLVVNNLNSECFIYRNNTQEKGIRIKLKGSKTNTMGIGAKLTLYTNRGIQSMLVNPSRGFQSSVDYTTVFGIPDGHVIDSLVVIWPDKRISTVKLSADAKEVLVYYENSKTPYEYKINEEFPKYFEPVAGFFDKHSEDEHIDFYYEPGIFRMTSRDGPKSCVADINGDGLDDIFVCGAAGQAGQIYLQTSKGFKKSLQKALDKDFEFEDTACSITDIDGDGDLDLVVGSGGNHHIPNSPYLADRIYINDGKGSFSRSEKFIQSVTMNTSVVLPWDFDEDGDEDLLLFSRSVPQHYGYQPVHFVYENLNNETLAETTETKFKILNTVGMVTDAKLMDSNGDGKKNRLVVVGEWMEPMFFEFKKDEFVRIETEMDDLKGLYFSVGVGDLNNDKIDDLVFGNLGTNSYLKGTAENPIHLWINDFDDNKSAEKIISQVIDGQDKPLYGKKDLAAMVQNIKKSSIKNHDYARRTMEDLFGKEKMRKASKRVFNHNLSFVALSAKNGKFIINTLPNDIQLSAMKAILLDDVDNDGFLDIIGGGNEFGFIPQFSRLDASYGNLLLNDKSGRFNVVVDYVSGICVKGEVKDIKKLSINNRKHLLFLLNDDFPLLLRQK